MATYKDDLDILKAAEKADTNKLTFNAITELDNKGLLGRYGGEGEEEESGGIDLGITGASAGEYAKIKTVDENGVPTEWESGSGGSTGGGALILHEDEDGVLDKTWREIATAMSNGTLVVTNYVGTFGDEITSSSTSIICFVQKAPSSYDVFLNFNFETPAYSATTANDYPVANEG